MKVNIYRQGAYCTQYREIIVVENKEDANRILKEWDGHLNSSAKEALVKEIEEDSKESIYLNMFWDNMPGVCEGGAGLWRFRMNLYTFRDLDDWELIQSSDNYNEEWVA